MATIPELQKTTIRAIEQAVEARAESGFREHLGASLIGRPCERELWYSFRWCTLVKHEGRLLRLFARGQREEAVFCELLRSAGVEVHEHDENGRQFRFGAIGGHFGGSCDAAAVGFVEAPKTWHVVEMKTHNDKSFKALLSKGVQESKPEHYAQMQVYMLLSGMERAYYMAVNKNDDSLYGERVRFDRKFADSLVEKAERIICSDAPRHRLSEDPSWYQCKFCDHHALCHATAAPLPNCRTCAHATPARDGTWVCERHHKVLSKDEQLAGCQAHRFIPALLDRFAEPTDANEEDNWIAYRNTLTGEQFVNGADGLSSEAIHDTLDKRLLGAKENAA